MTEDYMKNRRSLFRRAYQTGDDGNNTYAEHMGRSLNAAKRCFQAKEFDYGRKMLSEAMKFAVKEEHHHPVGPESVNPDQGLTNRVYRLSSALISRIAKHGVPADVIKTLQDEVYTPTEMRALLCVEAFQNRVKQDSERGRLELDDLLAMGFTFREYWSLDRESRDSAILEKIRSGRLGENLKDKYLITRRKVATERAASMAIRKYHYALLR